MLLIKHLILFLFTAPGIILALFILNAFIVLRKNVTQKAKAILVTASILISYISTTSFITTPLLYNLENCCQRPAQLNNIDAIAVPTSGIFAGTYKDPVSKIGNVTLKRLNAACDVYNKIKKPIIILGGVTNNSEPAESVISQEVMLTWGLPKNKIILDATSKNSLENIKELKKIMTEQKFKKVLIVTSAAHAKRIKGLVKKYNIDAELYPTAYITTEGGQINDFIPSIRNMEINSMFLYEFLGNIKYGT